MINLGFRVKLILKNVVCFYFFESMFLSDVFNIFGSVYSLDGVEVFSFCRL